MGIEITCSDCGDRVPFSGADADTLPIIAECGGCGRPWKLSAQRLPKNTMTDTL